MQLKGVPKGNFKFFYVFSELTVFSEIHAHICVELLRMMSKFVSRQRRWSDSLKKKTILKFLRKNSSPDWTFPPKTYSQLNIYQTISKYKVFFLLQINEKAHLKKNIYLGIDTPRNKIHRAGRRKISTCISTKIKTYTTYWLSSQYITAFFRGANKKYDDVKLSYAKTKQKKDNSLSTLARVKSFNLKHNLFF